jgi:hypothetical protein
MYIHVSSHSSPNRYKRPDNQDDMSYSYNQSSRKRTPFQHGKKTEVIVRAIAFECYPAEMRRRYRISLLFASSHDMSKSVQALREMIVLWRDRLLAVS